MQLKINLSVFVVSVCGLLATSSCKKFVEIPPPPHQVISDVVFANDATATAAVLGIYHEMMNNSLQFSAASTTIYAGMYADELRYYSPSARDPFINSLLTEDTHGLLSSSFWAAAYRYIYVSNVCLEKLESSSSITSSLKNSLIGEVKFIRAFCYLNLVNLFGDVPLELTSDYRINSTIGRTPVSQVYNQVINDLTGAAENLPVNYTGSDRVRPNKWAAVALLARAYLYTGDWVNSEAAATSIISSGMYTLPSNLSSVFKKTSTETIWQLQPVNTLWNTWEGREFVPPSATAAPGYLLQPGLLSAFETNDNRKTAWVGTLVYSGQSYYYPNKYKVYGNGAPITENYVVLRLAELYLIRAEARAKQNNLTGSIDDLNIIRTRAGLPGTTASDQASLLIAVENERRIELFIEWGHRWFDLKRTGRANAVIGSLKPSTWQPLHVLWPIPINQINANPALIQNPGY
jgi:hypothetical protein